MNPLNTVKGAITTGVILSIILFVGLDPNQFMHYSLGRWLHILAGVMWIGLLYYFNVVQIPGLAAAGGYYVGKDDRSAERIAADAAITADVKARLIAEPGIRSLSINVDTFNANVTLKGDVKTAAQRATAEQLARRVKGVKSVRNELAVKG